MILSLNHLKCLYHVVKKRVSSPLPHTLQYFLKNDENQIISAWADVDIKLQGDTVTLVTQIPKQLSAKFELIKQLPHHPIMQDTRKNKSNGKKELRHYALPLPLINYGFIPMTWQQNLRPDSNGLFGDDDPIDVVDLTTKERSILDVSKVKVLGAFCLIDEGELDWKVITMDEEEANQNRINSVNDVPSPRIKQIMEWFKLYKTYDGKVQNSIGFDGKVFSKEQTLRVIHETHGQFLKLKEGKGTDYAPKKARFQL